MSENEFLCWPKEWQSCETLASNTKLFWVLWGRKNQEWKSAALPFLQSASERSALCEKKGKTDKEQGGRIKNKNAKVMKACIATSEALHCSPSNPPLTFHFYYAHEDPGAFSLWKPLVITLPPICTSFSAYIHVLSLLLHCILLWRGTSIHSYIHSYA